MLPFLKDSVALTAGWKSSVPRKLDAERRGLKHVLKIDLERRNQPNLCHPRGPILQVLSVLSAIRQLLLEQRLGKGQFRLERLVPICRPVSRNPGP